MEPDGASARELGCMAVRRRFFRAMILLELVDVTITTQHVQRYTNLEIFHDGPGDSKVGAVR